MIYITSYLLTIIISEHYLTNQIKVPFPSCLHNLRDFLYFSEEKLQVSSTAAASIRFEMGQRKEFFLFIV